MSRVVEFGIHSDGSQRYSDGTRRPTVRIRVPIFAKGDLIPGRRVPFQRLNPF